MTLEAHGRTVEMFVDPNDHIGRKLAAGRWYERDLLEDARQRMRMGTVVDVGAHVGNHTVWFGAVCRQRVVAIEPNPDTFAALLENTRRNMMTCWLVRAAAGSKEGSGRIGSVNESNTGMTTVVPGDGDVKVVTVDSLALQYPSLIKIDVEGSELDVLVGAGRTIAEHKPLIYVEAASDDSHAEVDGFLRPLGYRCFGEFGRTPTWGYAA